MIRRPPRSTQSRSSAASDVYKRQLLSQLIEGQALATVLHDTATGALGEAESTHAEALGGIEHADVIGDGSDHDGHLVLLASGELGQLGKGERGTVHLAHEQTLEHNLVEGGVHAASHEAIELHQQANVRVLAHGSGTPALVNTPSGFHVDSHGCSSEIPVLCVDTVSYTHLRAHETVLDLVCRLLLEKKKKK
eukprot:TRINITY_DN990_c0_g1_i9.p1 TRINITY_DN990_c0_g1~~TRINITY_DN990_c0_g1_i9.p1  ORF type:complete len:193 (-),score=81.55 TRINITY_DN990_c0_g1_i9:107-685(-)